MLKFLKYPFPYKSWLCISNDPDNTTLLNWKELNTFIWKDLKLPFGDALFIHSYNQNIKEQVCLDKHPEILNAHLHDSLHFWGDYQHSRNKNFDRSDAINALKILKEFNFNPLVWVDHSNNQGNFLHGNSSGTIKTLTDASNIEYDNFQYTLDLAIKSGIKYIWHGDISSVIGQDRYVSYNSFLKSKNVPLIKRFIYQFLNKINSDFPFTPKIKQKNKQVWPNKFDDGNILYCFERYGNWGKADIDGLANVISPKNIDQLISNEGTCIVYTHLGKRIKERMKDSVHIPVKTKEALQYLKNQYDKKNINLSSISNMLDYIVLRDHIEIDNKNYKIIFRNDGIRYTNLSTEDLIHHSFSFRFPMNKLNKLKIYINDRKVKFHLKSFKNIHTIFFNE